MLLFEEKALNIGIDKYQAVRKQTEKLCAPLQIEDYVLQPVTDVSPPKWHLAHTTWFFETFILSKFMEGYKPFHSMYSYIFNSYYESIGERVMRFDRGHLSRPTVKDVMDYRAYVDENMDRLIHQLKDKEILEFEKLFVIGLNHEQQHQELLVTDVKYILGHNPLMPEYLVSKELDHQSNKIPELEFLLVHGGEKIIGYEGESFGWDNEKPAHTVYIDDFEIANRLITNGEYLEFINDGGYKKFNFWLGEGWDLAKSQNWEAPMYWHHEDGQWMNYTLRGYKPINMNEPVTHISFYEADAFASWAGKRLLTEAEWEIAAKHFHPKSSSGNFVENENYHPVALQPSNGQIHQLLGDVWEWTYSGYFPYPGYKREEGALGEYNGKFMVNQMVLRGGSCATPENHMRLTYRNFFHADKRWQFSGIRLANQ